MSVTGRRGSTASGHLVWGAPETLPLVNFMPTPPPPVIVPPKIKVTRFDGLFIKGVTWHMTWDNQNGTSGAIEIDPAGIIHVTQTNAAGHDTTGAVRKVL